MANFKGAHNHKEHFLGDSSAENRARDHQPQGVIQTMMRDRFELLSAYLDGEVTAAERRQVEEWLTTDPEVRRLYGRLLNLRSGLQASPIPAPQPSAEMAAAVFKRIDRKQNLTLVWGGGAVAAVLIASICGVLSGREFLSLQMASSPTGPLPSDALMIALNEPVVEVVNHNDLILTVNQPVVEIPKTAAEHLQPKSKK